MFQTLDQQMGRNRSRLRLLRRRSAPPRQFCSPAQVFKPSTRSSSRSIDGAMLRESRWGGNPKHLPGA